MTSAKSKKARPTIDAEERDSPVEEVEESGSPAGDDQFEEVRLEEDSVDTLDIPPSLPILPLRGLVVFPHTAMPLTIGQPRSLKLVDEVSSNSDRIIGLFTSKDPQLEMPTPDEIYTTGTLAQIHRLFRAPDGTIRLLVQGLERITIQEYTQTEPFLQAEIELFPEELEKTIEVEALMRNVMEQFTRLAELVPNIPGELISSTLNFDEPLQFIYSIATYIRISLEEQQEILEIPSVSAKLHHLMTVMGKELEVLELGRKIQSEAQTEMEKVQREYFLREQLKAIQKELGEGDEQTLEVENFRKKIEEAKMTEEAEREARRELDRLAKLPTAAAEYGVIRTYLDWIVEVPWDKRTEDRLDIGIAREVLEEDHYGLEDVKERILEFLSVRKLKGERAAHFEEADSNNEIHRLREGVILCFVGPPGVGKTSLGASIARAMERKFVRMSLGGVRDEAEIRGFRRTYVGAMPGRLIQSLRRCGSRNPVVILDEVDKLGRDFRGDPASALLEVLDPEQNHEFRDHYLDVAFDLSEVMFITTANELDPIPPPLRDRMEIIQISGYTEAEKTQIALRYLIPRQVRENGLLPEEIDISEEAVVALMRDYTREAGVRNLERQIGAVVRKIATKIAEGETDPVTVEDGNIRKFLGHPKASYRTEIETRTDRPGVAVGLAWTPMGGDILFVEAAQMSGKQGFQFTGQLGEVMQESARAAFSYVRSNSHEFDIADDYFEKHDVHLHVPAGAIPKDGPSAGVTMTTALVSLITRRPVRSNVAMTGEITLRGQVLPVGGIKDKVLAADRLGIDTIILPKRNESDLEELPEEVRNTLAFELVEEIGEVLDKALLPANES